MPSVRNVVNVLNDVPLNSSQEDVAQKLVAMYGKMGHWQLQQWKLNERHFLRQAEIDSLQTLATDFRNRKR